MLLAVARGQDLPRRVRRRAGPAVGVGATSCSTSPCTSRCGRATCTRSPPGCWRPATRPPPSARSTTYGTSSSGRDGSFPQNARLDGEEVFDGRAARRGGLPDRAGLAAGPHRSRATGTHVRLSADYLVATGPRTGPGALGEHRRLLAGHDRRGDRGPRCAADIARKNGDPACADRYLATADAVAAQPRAVDADQQRAAVAASRTTCGSPTTATPTPARRSRSPTAGRWSTSARVVDPSFLEMVRLGVKSADDPTIASTLARDRPRAEVRHRQRAVLASLQLRRLRREGATAASGRRWTRARARRSAAAGRCSPASGASTRSPPGQPAQRVPGHDGPRGRRLGRPGHRRAGVGLQAARRRPGRASCPARTPSPRRRWPGRTPSSSAWRARSTRAGRSRRPQVVACRYEHDALPAIGA